MRVRPQLQLVDRGEPRNADCPRRTTTQSSRLARGPPVGIVWGRKRGGIGFWSKSAETGGVFRAKKKYERGGYKL